MVCLMLHKVRVIFEGFIEILWISDQNISQQSIALSKVNFFFVVISTINHIFCSKHVLLPHLPPD